MIIFNRNYFKYLQKRKISNLATNIILTWTHDLTKLSRGRLVLKKSIKFNQEQTIILLILSKVLLLNKRQKPFKPYIKTKKQNND